MSIVKNITIGAITGALVSGVPTIALASLFTEAEYIDFPLHQDKCPGYEVTTENFHIDTIKEGENEVEKSAAWAGQAMVCRGKHERDSPYPSHA